MKKLLLILAAVSICFAISGCGNKESEETNNNNVSNNTNNSSVVSDNNNTSSNTENSNTVSNNNNSSSSSTNSENMEENWNKLQEIAPDTAGDIKEGVSNLSVSASNNKYVLKQGENLTAIYYHNGQEITGYEARVKYENHEEAVLAKGSADYTEADDIESVDVEGDELVVKYKPAAYAGTSLEEIKQAYEAINIIQGN